MAISSVEERMNVGVHLRAQIVGDEDAPVDTVATGCKHRVDAINLGIISFVAQMTTTVIGDSVTDDDGEQNWTVPLVIPGSPDAKSTDQGDTTLTVRQANEKVAFRTTGILLLFDDIALVEGTARLVYSPVSDSGRYMSRPLDLFSVTA